MLFISFDDLERRMEREYYEEMTTCATDDSNRSIAIEVSMLYARRIEALPAAIDSNSVVSIYPIQMMLPRGGGFVRVTFLGDIFHV